MSADFRCSIILQETWNNFKNSLSNSKLRRIRPLCLYIIQRPKECKLLTWGKGWTKYLLQNFQLNDYYMLFKIAKIRKRSLSLDNSFGFHYLCKDVTSLWFFERKQALLVALQGESSWRGGATKPWKVSYTTCSLSKNWTFYM